MFCQFVEIPTNLVTLFVKDNNQICLAIGQIRAFISTLAVVLHVTSHKMGYYGPKYYEQWHHIQISCFSPRCHKKGCYGLNFALSHRVNGEIIIILIKSGPWWWSSGQRARLPFRVRIPLTTTVFTVKFVLKRTKLINKKGLGLAHFKNPLLS